MATILEALENAEFNLNNVKTLGPGIIPLIKDQIHNSVVLLEKGYDPYQEIEAILEAHGSVEHAPDLDD